MKSHNPIIEIISEIFLAISFLIVIISLSEQHVELEKYRIKNGLVRCKSEGYVQWTIPERCDVKK